VLPTKGIPLPFVSAGGTSMLLSSAAVGVLLSIARQSAGKPAESKLQHKRAAVIETDQRKYRAARGVPGRVSIPF